jgi:hypothetical protein
VVGAPPAVASVSYGAELGASGPIPTADPVLKNRLLPVENLGSDHLLYAMATGQGPLTASNSCACFNRNSSRFPSAKCLEAETAEQIISHSVMVRRAMSL